MENRISTTAFIASESSVAWFGESVSIYHCRYAMESFTGNLYSQLGVPFPQELSSALTKRKAEFLAGRYCARRSLAKYGVVDAAIGRNKKRNPIWPDHFVGSISHSGNWVIAASALWESYSGVGVDIESVVDEDFLVKSQNRILSMHERNLMKENALDPCLFLTLAFSVKESFFKAVYPSVGKYFGFSAVLIREICQKTRCLLLEVSESLGGRWERGKMLWGHYHLCSDSHLVTMVAVSHA